MGDSDESDDVRVFLRVTTTVMTMIMTIPTVMMMMMMMGTMTMSNVDDANRNATDGKYWGHFPLELTLVQTPLSPKVLWMRL